MSTTAIFSEFSVSVLVSPALQSSLWVSTGLLFDTPTPILSVDEVLAAHRVVGLRYTSDAFSSKIVFSTNILFYPRVTFWNA